MKFFWRTPELVEKLLPFLDLETTKQLAKAHELTLLILGKAFIWNKLAKRTFPVDENFDLKRTHFWHQRSQRRGSLLNF